MNSLSAEITEINKAVDLFAAEMKQKLAAKAVEGYFGWNEITYRQNVCEKLRRKANLVEFDTAQAVDIANLSMMLWIMPQVALIKKLKDEL